MVRYIINRKIFYFMSDDATRQLFIDYLLCENSCLKTQCSQTSELLQTMQFNNDMLNDVITNTFDVSGNMSSFVRIQVYDHSGNVASCVTTDCCGNFIPCMEFDGSGNSLPCILPPMNEMLLSAANSHKDRGLYDDNPYYSNPYRYHYKYPYWYHDNDYYRYYYPYDYYKDYPYGFLFRDLSCSTVPRSRELPPQQPRSTTQPQQPMLRPLKQNRFAVGRWQHAVHQNAMTHSVVQPHGYIHPAPMHHVKPTHFHRRRGKYWWRYSGLHNFPYF